MSTKRQKVINMLVLTNFTQTEIAAKVDMAEETISRWKKQPKFQEELAAAQRNFLDDLARPAIRAMRELLESESDQVKLQAAKDILDRTGYKPVEKQEIVGALDIASQADKYKKYLLEDEN